jgi:hypothetical protein
MSFLGDFSLIDLPAKKGVRLGQSFATSRNYSKANILIPKDIEDIEAEVIDTKKNF